MTFKETLKEQGFELPKSPNPVGSYHPMVVSGETAFLSGQLPKTNDGHIIQGVLGRDLSLEEGQRAAQQAALNVLSVIDNQLGIDSVDRILKVVGYVQVSPEFKEIPQVMNGASDLFLNLLGEKAVHARSAVGVAGLPLNAAIELEVTLKVKQ